jgi:hypothetical protein
VQIELRETVAATEAARGAAQEARGLAAGHAGCG